MNASIQIAIASFLLFIGVATGAFGSHALANNVSLPALAVWETAVLYLFIHALGMLGLACAQPLLLPRLQHIAFTALLIGTLLFSGSLFLLVLSGQSWLGMVTPLGGLFMLIGWLCVVIAALKKHKANKNQH